MTTAAAQGMLYATITRIDRERREVTLVATSETLDSFGTRFSFEASVAAFQRAWGNVREMHANKAVGRIVAWTADAARRLITVVVRISRGAEDTWQKLLDGTLRGASIGASNVEWERGTDGLPVATAYDLVELSLVDNPSNPDCQVLIVRMGADPCAAHGGVGATIRRGGRVMARRAGPGPVPANSLSGELGNAADAVNAVQPQSVGKLVLATSTDPEASDYGVPPRVGVAATPFVAGQSGWLSNTATSGAFHPGGHQHMPGSSAFETVDFGEPYPTWETDEMHPPLAGAAPTRPTPAKRNGQQHAARDGRSQGMMPQWHAMRDSAIDHATGVMESCGCPTCATVAQTIRATLAEADGEPDDAAPTAGRMVVATAERAFQRQVAGAFTHLSGVLAALTERVELIATQPLPGGPVAMATRGFTQLPVEQQIATLQRFAARSGDPNVQAEAAATILSLQQQG